MPDALSTAELRDQLGRILAARDAGTWRVQPLQASGFCATWRAECAGRTLFVKTQPASSAEMLHAEADGLRALAAATALRVPAVDGLWELPDGGAALALEWLDLHRADAGFGARFGAALARVHRADCPLHPAGFGWHRDNWLGTTQQANQRSAAAGTADWIAFFGEQRLAELAFRLDRRDSTIALVDAARQVIAALPRLFDDGYQPRPALIHGDLWSGNWGMLGDGTPVVFDPAVSCSDAEAELAMMELFGGLPPGFWPAYRDAAGLHPGYARRRPAYQLYHLLNHVLLFGGYESQALACARQALRLAG